MLLAVRCKDKAHWFMMGWTDDRQKGPSSTHPCFCQQHMQTAGNTMSKDVTLFDLLDCYRGIAPAPFWTEPSVQMWGSALPDEEV